MARTLVASDGFTNLSNFTALNPLSNTLSISGGAFAGDFAATPGQPEQAAVYRYSGAGSFADDQYSSVVIGGSTFAFGYGVGVAVRCGTATGSSRNLYGVYVGANANRTTHLYKIVAGTITILHSEDHAWVAGDRVELEVEGTTLRVCKNGTALGGSFTQTDTSLTTGTPGISGAGNSGANGFTGDDWEGGSLGAAGASATLAMAAEAGVFSGSASSPAVAALAMAAEAGTFSGTASVDRTITSGILKDNSGTPLISTALNYVAVYDASTGALVTRQTGLSTDGTGRFRISHPSFVATANAYRVDWEASTGERRMPLATAA